MGEANLVHKTDVLVLGTGMAGFFAAIKASEMGADVTIVGDGESGFTGQSVGGTHRLRAVLPEDDFEAALKGTVIESEYMIDQEFAESALKETWVNIQALQKMGIDFRKGDDGNIQWYFGDTQDPDFKQRNIVWEPMGSYRHLLKVKKEALKRGVKVVDRVMVTALLTSGSAVCGAAGFGSRTGEFHVFEAKAVVVATGTFSGGAVTNPSLAGDGVAMAFHRRPAAPPGSRVF